MTSRARQASVASEGRLQHAITVQREQRQVEFQRLSTLLEGLPAGHPARSSWLEVDEFAQTLITSCWPSATTGVDLGFDDRLCHYVVLRRSDTLREGQGRAGHP
jgi:hypothetical protein